MKSLISILLLVTLAFLFESCKDSGSIFSPLGTQSDKMEFTITGSADGMTTAPAGMDKPYRHFEGDGPNTPGGECHVVMDYWAIPATPLTGSPAYGNAVLTTETGDKIYGTNIRGTYVIDPVTHIVTCNVTFDLAGGTGAYDNIIGIVHGIATINEDRTTHIDWTGTYSHAKPFGAELTAVPATVQNPTCSPGYTRRHAEGSGTAIHLGSCLIEMEHCINFTTGVVKNGEGKFIVNNGDQINATYDGFVVPIPNSNNAAAKLFCTITGGTGKYTNAEGYYLVQAIQMPDGSASGSFDGVIDW